MAVSVHVGEAETVDASVAAACLAVLEADGPRWSPWEVARSLDEIADLASGDCCYDRPSVGVAYALYHHPGRTHDALRVIEPLLERNGSEPLTIVDLGCGTGATACAVALALERRRREGRTVPDHVEVVGCDQSPFMTQIGERVVAEVQRRVGPVPMSSGFRACAWEKLEPRGRRTVIVGGFLFDHSDKDHAPDIAARLSTLADHVGAVEIALTTVARKKPVLDEVARRMRATSWSSGDETLALELPGGPMQNCADLRAAWYRHKKSTKTDSYLRNIKWRKGPFACQVLRRGRGESVQLAIARPSVVLNDEQRAVVDLDDDRPTIIFGPAGSGKTLVLGHRIAALAVSRRAQAHQRMLVTTFNKDIVRDLVRLVYEALADQGLNPDQVVPSDPRSACVDGRAKVTVRAGGRTTEIAFLNRDKIPGMVAQGLAPPTFGHDITPIIAERRERLSPADREAVEGVSDAFIQREFELFIVARGRLTRDQYLAADREGAGREVAVRGRRKAVIWDLVGDEPIPSYATRRLEAVRADAASTGGKWSHVFVDECQDLGEAELRMLADLAVSPRRLCIAGDPSQAIHLGSTYRRPTFEGAPWRPAPLTASYRMPLRMCEALRPVAEHLVQQRPRDAKHVGDAVLLGPHKAGPLGVRPIVVEAENLKHQLREMAGLYAPIVGDDRRALVASIHGDAVGAVASLEQAGYRVDAGLMKQFKGTERPVVIVCDRASRTNRSDDLDDDSLHLLTLTAFTALTRAQALLVIALEKIPGLACPDVRGLLRLMREDRLLFWTEEAQRRYHECKIRDVMPARKLGVRGEVA